MNRAVLAVSILMVLAALPGRAQEIKPCPDELPVGAVKISPPAGWVGVTPARLLLTAADVVVGDAGNGALIGRRRKSRGGYEVAYEEINAGLPPRSEIWLACRYGDLALVQRLPGSTDRCVVSYHKNQYNGHDIDVACHTKP